MRNLEQDTIITLMTKLNVYMYNAILVYTVAFQLAFDCLSVCGQSQHPLFKWVESTHHHQGVQRRAQVPVVDLLQ